MFLFVLNRGEESRELSNEKVHKSFLINALPTQTAASFVYSQAKIDTSAEPNERLRQCDAQETHLSIWRWLGQAINQNKDGLRAPSPSRSRPSPDSPPAKFKFHLCSWAQANFIIISRSLDSVVRRLWTRTSGMAIWIIYSKLRWSITTVVQIIPNYQLQDGQKLWRLPREIFSEIMWMYCKIGALRNRAVSPVRVEGVKSSPHS